MSLAVQEAPQAQSKAKPVPVYEALKRLWPRWKRAGQLPDRYGYRLQSSRGKDCWRFHFVFEPAYPSGYFNGYAYDGGAIESSPGE
jgi:hypothetical protein